MLINFADNEPFVIPNILISNPCQIYSRYWQFGNLDLHVDITEIGITPQLENKSTNMVIFFSYLRFMNIEKNDIK